MGFRNLTQGPPGLPSNDELGGKRQRERGPRGEDESDKRRTQGGKTEG